MLRKCIFSWDVYTTSADLNICGKAHSNSIMSWKLQAQKLQQLQAKLLLSRSINLLSRLFFSCLHDWLPLTSIFVTADSLHYGNWNNYWSEHKTIMSDGELYIQAISADPKQPVNPVFCVTDSRTTFSFYMYCVWGAAAAAAAAGYQCSAASSTFPEEEVMSVSTEPQYSTVSHPVTGYQRHWTTKLYKSLALNNVCVLVNVRALTCDAVYVFLWPLLLVLQAWLIF